MKLKLKDGQRVIITNIDKMWNPNTEEDEIDYWKYIVGKKMIATGFTDERYHHDDEYDYYERHDGDCDDDRTSEETYELKFINQDGEEDTIYLFARNFEVIKL